jgi:hypothetical protein
MTYNLNLKIPQRSIVFFVVCVCGILIFILGIIPMQTSLITLDREIKNLQFQIKEQKDLYPLYQSLTKQIQNNRRPGLPFPPKQKIQKNKIPEISLQFREIVRNSGMRTLSTFPELTALAANSNNLLFHLKINGEFLNFRKFLSALGNISYVEHIEEIQINQDLSGLEFNLKIWIAITT